jgi:hypothetical protein
VIAIALIAFQVLPLAACTHSAYVDSDGPFLFTDPPLPTFSEKTARPTEAHGEYPLPECVDWVVQVEMYPGNEPLLRMAAVIVVGKFQGYGETRWNTTTGQRPSSKQYLESGYPITIVRDIRVESVEFVRGSEPALAGAYVRGGRLGCDVVSYDNVPELRPGQRLAFFFSLPPGSDPESEGRPQLMRVWPIDGQQNFTPATGPSLTLEELRDLASFTPYAPEDPMGSSAQ